MTVEPRKIMMQVEDVDRHTFEPDHEISKKEWDEMSYRLAERSMSDKIDDFMRNGRSSRNSMGNRKRSDKDFEFKIVECTGYLYNAGNKLFSDDELDGKIRDGKMFVLTFNIDPNDMDYDLETELRFWINDSNGILRDVELPNDLKIKSLPMRDFYIYVNDRLTALQGCKIVNINSSRKHPYLLSTLVTKMKYLR